MNRHLHIDVVVPRPRGAFSTRPSLVALLATSAVVGPMGCAALLDIPAAGLEPCADGGCADASSSASRDDATLASDADGLAEVAADAATEVFTREASAAEASTREASTADRDGAAADRDGAAGDRDGALDAAEEQGSLAAGACGIGLGTVCEAGLCCHFMSSIKCEKDPSCPAGVSKQVCDPGGPNPCPQGQRCDADAGADGYHDCVP